MEGYGVLDDEYTFSIEGTRNHDSTRNLDAFSVSASLDSTRTAQISAYNGTVGPSGKPYIADIYMIGISLARIRVKL